MSLRHQKIGWIGAAIVALLSPATTGFMAGFLDGIGLGPSLASEIIGLIVGIALAVIIVMGTASMISRSPS